MFNGFILEKDSTGQCTRGKKTASALSWKKNPGG